MSESNETYPCKWMPVFVDGPSVIVVGWDGYSYVDDQGRTYWSGAAEPSEADALDAVTTPRERPTPVPAEITRAQFIIAIRRVLGLTEGAVYATITAAEDFTAEQKDDARDWFENALTFRRDHALLNAFAEKAGVTAAQLDDVFRLGATLD